MFYIDGSFKKTQDNGRYYLDYCSLTRTWVAIRLFLISSNWGNNSPAFSNSSYNDHL